MHCQISPFRVWHEAKNKMFGLHKETFLSELGWREFSYHLLYHFPKINKQNLKEQFNKLDWNVNDDLLLKWKKGKTGFPIVDAGMRELWDTGYMHNRLRMITASFLVKNLLIHWKEGEKWFWDCLLDGILQMIVLAGNGLLVLDQMLLHFLEFLIQLLKVKNLIKMLCILENTYLRLLSYQTSLFLLLG